MQSVTLFDGSRKSCAALRIDLGKTPEVWFSGQKNDPKAHFCPSLGYLQEWSIHYGHQLPNGRKRALLFLTDTEARKNFIDFDGGHAFLPNMWLIGVEYQPEGKFGKVTQIHFSVIVGRQNGKDPSFEEFEPTPENLLPPLAEAILAYGPQPHRRRGVLNMMVAKRALPAMIEHIAQLVIR